MAELKNREESLLKINKKYNIMQKKYGDKSLDAITNGGKINNPDICFVFVLFIIMHTGFGIQ